MVNYFHIILYVLNLYICGNYDVFDGLYSLMLASIVIYYILIFIKDEYVLMDDGISFVLLQISSSHLFFQYVLFIFTFIHFSAHFFASLLSL